MDTNIVEEMTPFSHAPRLQLWSDANQENFAVGLSNELNFRVVSNPVAVYTVLIDEAEFLHDMEYDWNYLLTHWMGVRNGEIKLDAGEKGIESAETDSPGRSGGKKAQGEKPKAILKCRYCSLYYSSEKKRSEHEAIWHVEKMGMALS